MNVLIGFSRNKDTIEFNGVLNGQPIKQVLLANRVVEEGQYMISFNESEVVGESLIVEVINLKKVN